MNKGQRNLTKLTPKTSYKHTQKKKKKKTWEEAINVIKSIFSDLKRLYSRVLKE